MVVGKAEGWALCRRKPRYSVCLLTGRAKSPPLELPGACGGSARDSACGWREARRTALRRRSVAAGPAHARTVDQPRRPAIGPPACVASLRRPFRFRRGGPVQSAALGLLLTASPWELLSPVSPGSRSQRGEVSEATASDRVRAPVNEGRVLPGPGPPAPARLQGRVSL